jgi:predicted enzyme related to lactoylglutathione lyase
MAAVVSTVIYPVKDLAQATTLFSAVLGVAPSSEAPYYVGFQVGGQDIGLDPNGHGKGMTGPVPYVEVDDITRRLDQLLDAGATTQQPITDVGGGKLVAIVRDADGNPIGLIQSP